VPHGYLLKTNSFPTKIQNINESNPKYNSLMDAEHPEFLVCLHFKKPLA
jgi:hypothetical protein